MKNEEELKKDNSQKEDLLKVVKIVIIIIIISCILALFGITNTLKNDIEEFKETFLKLYNTEVLGGHVNLTEQHFQPISSHFNVTITEVNQHLTGIKVSGRILNLDSIIHQDAEFQINVSDQTKTFIIKYLPPGYAKKFDVYIPDVPLEETKWATLKYLRSMINYRK